MSLIRNFTDLNTWKEGHKLVLLVYKATSLFPNSERFGLTSQMRRCSVSITSNIAEGFSRRSKKEKTQFYYMAKGSLTELQNQLLIAKDVNFLEKEIFKDIAGQTKEVSKLLTGLIRSAQR